MNSTVSSEFSESICGEFQQGNRFAARLTWTAFLGMPLAKSRTVVGNWQYVNNQMRIY
jgi:hypothetical protein